MSALEVLAILALTSWAVYRQTTTGPVRRQGRFRMAALYVGAGLAVGGFDLPAGPAGWAMVLAGFILSVVVGLVRGRFTRVWREPDGSVLRRGTGLTVGLFLGMVAVKFLLGTWAYLAGIDDGAGFGEVLVMLGLTVAVQAEIVWRRATALDAVVAAAPVGTDRLETLSRSTRATSTARGSTS